MAKPKSSEGGRGGRRRSAKKGASPRDAPDALRDASLKAAEFAANPVARSMLAAGLVTAAAALTANAKVRATVRDAGRDALDTAEAAADSASRIGAAIVTAATEAVRRLLVSDEGQAMIRSRSFARANSPTNAVGQEDAGESGHGGRDVSFGASQYYTPETAPIPSAGVKAILDAIERPARNGTVKKAVRASAKATHRSPGDVRSLRPTDKGLRGVALMPPPA